MARKTKSIKEMRAQVEAAEARDKDAKKSKKPAAKGTKAKKEKPAAEAKKPAAKKPSRRKVAKDVRLKAFWGVFTQAMKRVAMFEYADKKAADKKAEELAASSRVHHFVSLVKEPIGD
ncbi:MAG: hypothetical protein FJ284_00575 [Planctomycetes bacterium]|nr:hypothetical protein [Planctomycetota bacterium]